MSWIREREKMKCNGDVGDDCGVRYCFCVTVACAVSPLRVLGDCCDVTIASAQR